MFDRVAAVIGYFSDSPLRSVTATSLVVISFSLLEFALHVAITRLEIPLLADAAFDALLVGLLAGLAFWILLVAIRYRRDRVRMELERIAEINHEIRNALQIITHSHFNAEPQHREMILASVERVESVLKRLFPPEGFKAQEARQSRLRRRKGVL